ncbi:MAG: hypothetical protein H7259_09350 [Cytophagales bacterium]|nr:hypothetical protein [Cytophaga sp.]
MVKIAVECTGWLGAALVLAAFFLISTDKVTSASSLFQWLNITGALGLIVHTIYNDAYPSACVNIIWVGVAVYSLMKHHKTKKDQTS